eukprot:TRINITY_DN5041_c0_g1_i3.p1 TRINITY_DN5041_c0_g1~~TRINITY_DN5041_c0_g1_i3.p1  ORF type:complete len:249 (-),score=53.06 TRINITY_DN5041_c0_g1_i3:48-794(-)
MRYVRYFARYLREYHWVEPPIPFPLSTGAPYVLTNITFSSVPRFDAAGGCCPYFKIVRFDGRKLYDSRKVCKPKAYSGKKSDEEVKWSGAVEIPCNARIRGDIKIVFLHEDQYSFDHAMFHLWVNTAFFEENFLRLPKMEIDKAVKDKSHKKFDENFTVELNYHPDDVAVMEVVVNEFDSADVMLRSFSSSADIWNIDSINERLVEIEGEIDEERRKCANLTSQLEEVNEELEQLTAENEAMKHELQL